MPNLEEENRRLAKENAELKEENERLAAENAKLKKRLEIFKQLSSEGSGSGWEGYV